MNSRYRRVYEMALRVISFMNANLESFSAIAVVQTYLNTLNANAAALNKLGIDKIASTDASKSAVLSKGDRRDFLRDMMQNISDIWKSMADEIDSAGYKFRMPVNQSDQNLVAAARNFFTGATALKAEFISRGMPADFLVKLAEYTDDFEQSINESEDARRERVGVNAAFVEPVRSCTKTVEKLNPIVKMVFRGNPQKSAEWLVASHIERAPQSAKETA